MTTTTQAPRQVTVPGAPSVPQVNLLPPEVRASRVLGRLKVWLGVGLLAVVLGVGLGFVWAAWTAKQAEQDLAEVQDRNQSLLAQQNQYAEVPTVLRQLSDLTDARSFGMQAETLWQPYLAAIAAVTPTEVSVVDVSVNQVTPWSTSVTALPDPLATAGTVGNVSITGRSQTVPDTSTWEDGLAAVPGVVDVNVVTVQLSADQEKTFYQVTATMNITTDAFANRFVAEGN
ncbi:MAG: hypothetical protein KQH57_08735 [Actinomycetales bacterium]|nr:hypothetical protein [Actinomycetales bacterium]